MAVPRGSVKRTEVGLCRIVTYLKNENETSTPKYTAKYSVLKKDTLLHYNWKFIFEATNGFDGLELLAE